VFPGVFAFAYRMANDYQDSAFSTFHNGSYGGFEVSYHRGTYSGTASGGAGSGGTATSKVLCMGSVSTGGADTGSTMAAGVNGRTTNGTGCVLDRSMAAPNNVQIPPEMIFTDDNMVSVIAYTCLFIVAACGNLTVFITLFRNRQIKSRVNLFIMHLCIADLIVTFIMMPLEIAWHITVAWVAGDAACRIMMFFRAFGFYLSSFILVTISLDRYFAILHPLSMNDADKRGKIMLGLSWVFSVVSSIPQVR
jgi:hypothetical protein